jgi:hypothetical protein
MARLIILIPVVALTLYCLADLAQARRVAGRSAWFGSAAR